MRYRNPNYMKEYYQTHREQIRATERQRIREHILHTNGKRFYVHKREHPLDDKCELCGVVSRLLRYHHWDDENMDMGMWLCSKCQNFTHGIEGGFSDKYQWLKEQVRYEVAQSALL